MAQERPVQAVPKKQVRPMVDLVQAYFEVLQCWNNHAIAVRKHMTVERALNTLREVRDEAWYYKEGKQLSLRAHRLLWEIVNSQADGNIDEPNSARRH